MEDRPLGGIDSMGYGYGATQTRCKIDTRTMNRGNTGTATMDVVGRGQGKYGHRDHGDV